MTELTERDWDELARDLRARVAVFAPEWTDQAESDPGVTIVELFAFLAESVLDRADGTSRGRARLQEIVEHLGRVHAAPCPDRALIRNRFFAGKLLSADDFEEEQHYHRAKHRRHNRLLHGSGIVSGLEVSLEPGQPGGGPVVVVSPGVAIGPDGEELLLCEPATSDLCRGKAVCYVTVGLAERPTDVDADGQASRIEEAAEIAVLEDVAPGHLVIARIARAGDTWRRDPSFEPLRVR